MNINISKCETFLSIFAKKVSHFNKEIKKIGKELKELNYVDKDLPKEVAINIDFARKHLAETIYKQAILEGVATTLLDTENIIEGGKVNKNVILSETDYSILCMVNKLVEEGFYYNAGMLRNIPVNISGTNWKPEIPIERDIKDDIKK